MQLLSMIAWGEAPNLSDLKISRVSLFQIIQMLTSIAQKTGVVFSIGDKFMAQRLNSAMQYGEEGSLISTNQQLGIILVW